MRCLLVRSNFVRKYDTIILRIASSFLDYVFMIGLHNMKSRYSYISFLFAIVTLRTLNY